MDKNRKKMLITAILAFVLCFCCIFGAACAQNNKDYSVTVLNPENSAVANVTVSLVKDDKVVASAITDQNGVATFSLPAGKYSVKLADLPSGLGFYEEVTTDSLGTPLTLSLEKEKQSYTATVKKADGSAAANITVVWTNTDGKTAEATTDADGVAKVMLLSASYTVSVKNPPEGYFTEAKTATATAADVTMSFVADTRLNYTVSVVTEGGLHYPNIEIEAIKNGTVVETVATDENGVAVLKLLPDTYDIEAYIPYGYYTDKNSYTLSPQNTSVEILISSLVIPWEAPDDVAYTIGSIMYDFTVTTFDGRTIVLSELLESKKAVVLNFWYTTCSWCAKEFPVMWNAYQSYADRLEIVALDPYPSDFCYKYQDDEANRAEEAAIIAYFRSQCGLADATFPMGMDNAPVPYGPSIGAKFPIEGFPTTVIIDRYGAVAFIESGAILQESTWNNLFEKYTKDNYVQNFVPGEIASPEPTVEREKPDVEMPASSVLEDAVNNTQSGFNFSYRPETETDDKEYSWPWIASTHNGQSVIVPTNSKHDLSFATVHTDVTLKKGQAVAFDFLSSTESGADILFVSVDSLVQFQISGLSTDWETCYAFVAAEDGVYDISLLYYKDTNYYDGDDTVYIKNMRLCNAEDIDVVTDIMRACVWNFDGDNGFLGHVTAVFGEDGFYHVDNANGPLLFFDLAHPTNWSGYSIAEYIYDETSDFCMIDLDGDGRSENCADLLDHYMGLAVYSDFAGMLPVSQECYSLITKLMDNVTMKAEHRHLGENEWLEACKYVSRYGTDEPIKNPIAGLTPDTAIVATEGKNVFTLLKPVYPLSGLAYKFTPQEDGVYRFHSEGEDVETQVFLYTEQGIEDGRLAYCGDDILGRFPTDDNDNFDLYYCLEKGTTYYITVAFYMPGSMGSFDFYITNMGKSYSVVEHCTPGYHTALIDDNDNYTGLILQSVETRLVDGKYYAVNENGSLTPVLVDITGFTHANPFMPLERIVDADYYGIKVFDFTKEFVLDEEGFIIFDEKGKALVKDADGKDYTARMKEICATKDENGFVEATEELVEILTLYAKREIFGLDNDWLMFCKYNHTYGPAEEE